jgi:hypothetical protein
MDFGADEIPKPGFGPFPAGGGQRGLLLVVGKGASAGAPGRAAVATRDGSGSGLA